MKAARLHQPGGPLTVEDVPRPSAGQGELLLRTQACGLCHSDLFIQSLESLPKVPLTLGHEAIGVIEEAGPAVTGWQPGDRVGLTYLFSGCRSCEVCQGGRPDLCGRQLNTGYHVDGAFADYVVARAESVIKVPRALQAEQAAPLCCAGWTSYRAVKSTELEPGSWLAIFGIGGLGHLGVQFAKLRGLRVAAVDVADDKLSIARKLGAEIVINASEEDPARALKKVGGVHGAISFVASASTVRQAFKSLRRGAVLVLVGLAPETFALPLVDTVLKQIRIHGSFLGTKKDLAEIFAFAAEGKLQMETRKCSLEGLPDAMEQMSAGKLTGRTVVTFP